MCVVGKIHSMESFGAVDGPGVRFVVFMQGCPFKCLYCHNPDTWDQNAGKEYSVDEVVNSIKKFIPYIKSSGGGVTVTGGEPLMQIDFIVELFKKLKELDIHTAIDTNGFVGGHDIKINNLLKFTDLVLLSIKHMNDEEHRKITGCSNHNTLEFARLLDRHNIPLWIRYVVVPGLTDDLFSIKMLKKFIHELSNVENIEILPFHKSGEHKWKELQMRYTLENVPSATNSMVKAVEEVIKS